MRDLSSFSIVATPLQAGQLKNCPHCLQPLSQNFIRTQQHEKLGKVLIYRCRKCEQEVSYVVALPAEVV